MLVDTSMSAVMQIKGSPSTIMVARAGSFRGPDIRGAGQQNRRLRASAGYEESRRIEGRAMTSQRDHDYIEYVTLRLPALRRLALLLCQDLHRADDLVQQAIIRVYLHWPKAARAGNIDAYVHTIVVREFLHERRSSWTRRVSVTGDLPDTPAATPDQDWSLDL